MNILFLRAGIFSHVNEYLYQALCRSYHVVGNIDAGRVIKRKALRFSSWYNIFHTMVHSGRYWRQVHSKNSYAFSRMTQYCNQFVTSRTDYDIIFQTQCKFSITENPYSRPYFIYTDLTQKLTDRIWPKWALKATNKERQIWYQMEQEAYHRAEKIFTFNNYTKASFIEDYHLEPEKVIVIGPGINGDNQQELDFDQKYHHGFTLFFLSSEFDRQGGATVLKSYNLIKQKKPEMRMVLAGKCPRHLPHDIEVYHGLSEEMIDKILTETIIFLMPGRLGGVQSVLQAMSKKCLCIVGDSNILLADLVKNNQTGIVIKSDDPIQLADCILELCSQLSRVKDIAEQAHRFVYENFTWDHVVQKMTPYFKN